MTDAQERDMLERRVRMMAGSNADDWRWYQNAARQAIRSLDEMRKRAQQPAKRDAQGT